jgi:hypothetical protein
MGYSKSYTPSPYTDALANTAINTAGLYATGTALAPATGGLSLGAAFIISGLIQLGGSILGSMTAKRPPKSIDERNYEAIVDYYSDLGEKAKITRQIASVYTGKPVSDYGGSIGFRDALEIMKAKGFDFGELNDVVSGVDTVGGTITIKPGGATQAGIGRDIAPSDEEVKAYTDAVKGGDIAKTGPAMAGIVQGMAGRVQNSPLRFEHAGGEVSRTATPTKAEFMGFKPQDFEGLYNRGVITEDEYKRMQGPLNRRATQTQQVYDRIYGKPEQVALPLNRKQQAQAKYRKS